MGHFEETLFTNLKGILKYVKWHNRPKNKCPESLFFFCRRRAVTVASCSISASNLDVVNSGKIVVLGSKCVDRQSRRDSMILMTLITSFLIWI